LFLLAISEEVVVNNSTQQRSESLTVIRTVWQAFLNLFLLFYSVASNKKAASPNADAHHT
jgi:hypothetical protein